MKISKKRIDDFKIEARIDKNVVFAGSFASFAPIFETASDSGAKCNDAFMDSFGVFDGFDSIGWYIKLYRVHVMLFDVVGTDR